jgi:hypothetical protein
MHNEGQQPPEKHEKAKDPQTSTSYILRNTHVYGLSPQIPDAESSQRYLASLSDEERKELAERLGISLEMLLSKNMPPEQGC